jgi:hypothetical protein
MENAKDWQLGEEETVRVKTPEAVPPEPVI